MRPIRGFGKHATDDVDREALEFPPEGRAPAWHGAESASKLTAMNRNWQKDSRAGDAGAGSEGSREKRTQEPRISLEKSRPKEDRVFGRPIIRHLNGLIQFSL